MCVLLMLVMSAAGVGDECCVTGVMCVVLMLVMSAGCVLLMLVMVLGNGCDVCC